jgi:hypothetical protein
VLREAITQLLLLTEGEGEGESAPADAEQRRHVSQARMKAEVLPLRSINVNDS